MKVLGAVWYLMSVDRIFTCWKLQCRHERNDIKCRTIYLDCATTGRDRDVWYSKTQVFKKCDGKHGNFNFGMFAPASHDQVASANFIEKYFYCLWFGLKNLRLVLLCSCRLLYIILHL